MKIKVIAEDIAAARAKRDAAKQAQAESKLLFAPLPADKQYDASQYCPIAQAIVRQCEGKLKPKDISVGKMIVEKMLPGVQYGRSWDLPELAQDFIFSFDASDAAEPFEFEIEGFEC